MVLEELELIEIGRREEKIEFKYSVYPGPPYLFMIIGGPPGVGKSSACSNLDAYLKKAGIDISRLLTDKTRKPRPDEEDGIDARFISIDAYIERMQNGEYAAHFDEFGGHGYRKRDIKKGLEEGHLFVQTKDSDALFEMSNANIYPEAVPIILISNKDNLEKAIRERPTYNEEAEERRIVSLPEKIGKFVGVSDKVNYIIFKPQEFYEKLDSGKYFGIDVTNDKLLRIMEREIWLRKNKDVYQKCLTPDENNQNFIDFLTRKIIKDISFEDLQSYLREKKIFEVRYEDINEDVINHFIYKRHQHISEDTLRYHFPLHIVAAIDSHGRRSIIFDKCGDDPNRREVISEFLTYWMDTYYDYKFNGEKTPKNSSYPGLIETINEKDGECIKMHDGPVFYLTHNLVPLSEESMNLTPFALNIVFADIDHESMLDENLTISPKSLATRDITRYRGDLEKAVINQRLDGYNTENR